MPKILLTRSHEDNKQLAELLIAKGYKIFEESLIKFSPQEQEIKTLCGIINNYTLIITSHYCARLIAERFPFQNIKCYVVGEGSKAILENKGFDIIDCFDNIEALVGKREQQEPLLYLRGNYISQQLKFVQLEKVIYHTTYANEFSNSLIEALKKHEIQGVVICSLKTAECLLACMKFNNLVEFLYTLNIYCLSSKIAEFFKAHGYNSIFYPADSNFKNFIQLF